MGNTGTDRVGTEWMTPAEVARKLRVSAETVRVMCKAGELPAAKVRNQYRIHVDDLRAYLDSQRIGGKEVNGSAADGGSDGLPSATIAG